MSNFKRRTQLARLTAAASTALTQILSWKTATLEAAGPPSPVPPRLAGVVSELKQAQVKVCAFMTYLLRVLPGSVMNHRWPPMRLLLQGF